MSLLDLKIIHNELYDLELANGELVTPQCGLDSTKYLAISVKNPSNSLSSSVIWDNANTTNSRLSEITRTGFDNFLINDLSIFNNGNYDPTYSIETSGSSFSFFAVSGVTTNLSYEILKSEEDNALILNGGFLQGYFKLHNFPVEFFPKRVNLGWTVDMVIEKMDLQPNGETLNTLNPNNSGFIFYMGTRAENKFNSEVDYKEIFDNAFGVRIREDGVIGYRKITVRNKCLYTKNMKKFYTFFDDSDAIIEENYSCRSVYNNGNTKNDNDTNKINRTNIVITFSRDFSLDGCELIYDTYRKGTIRIYSNGYLIYINRNFNEIMTRELLASYTDQETVPFYFSWGGGSQGLYESVNENGIIYENRSKPIEHNFAGSYTGKLYEFSMYTRPFNFLEIRKLFEQKKLKYNLDYPI